MMNNKNNKNAENNKNTRRTQKRKFKPRHIPLYGNYTDTENINNINNTGNTDNADNNKNKNKDFCRPEISPEYIKKTLKFKETDVLQINIKYPFLSVKSNPAAEKKINAFYTSTVRSFMGFCEKNLYKSAAAELLISQNAQNIQNIQNNQNNQDNQDNYDADNGYNGYNGYNDYNATESKIYTDYKNYTEFKPFGAVISFETPYISLPQTGETYRHNHENGFLCVYLDINIYSGKGRGNIMRKVQIWNLTDGELYSPQRVLNFGGQTKKRIWEHICKTMERQIRRGDERYINADMPDVYRQNVYKHLSINNMYLTSRGYAFFFPQGTIAPYERGIVDFIVPERVLYGEV